MAYDSYTDRVISSWDFSSQMALWRERALHQAQRAEYYKRLAEAERNGTTITPSGKTPATAGTTTKAGH